MKAPAWPLLLLLLPTCGVGGTAAPGETHAAPDLAELEAALLERLAEQRRANGAPPLSSHPALSRGAVERATSLAARATPTSSPAEVTATSDRLWRLGYRPHLWREAVIAGDLDASSLARAELDDELLRPDLEHVAVVCRSRPDGRPLCLLVVAERRVTRELRDAEPLRDLPAVRDAVLAEVNRQRAASRRRPLSEHPALDRAAQLHAEAMAEHGFYDHRAPDGSTARQRATAAGYEPALIAENIARALVPPADVVAQWMDSSGHRHNLLLPRAVHHGLGVAVAVRDGSVEVLWCELLAAP